MSDRQSIVRVLVGVVFMVAAGIGALVADIGFVDTAYAKGATGLWLWVPSVVLAIVGALLATTGRRGVTRVVVTVLGLLVPAFVLLRWFVALATS